MNRFGSLEIPVRAIYFWSVIVEIDSTELSDHVKISTINNINRTISDIECRNVSTDELVKLSEFIGKSQNKQFSNEDKEAMTWKLGLNMKPIKMLSVLW